LTPPLPLGVEGNEELFVAWVTGYPLEQERRSSDNEEDEVGPEIIGAIQEYLPRGIRLKVLRRSNINQKKKNNWEV